MVAQEGWGISSFLICVSNFTGLKRKSSLFHQNCTSTGAPDSLMTLSFRDRNLSVTLVLLRAWSPHPAESADLSDSIL